ncbi:gamma-glutamyltransferase [Paraglaciecola aquimarina]|uniref:Gamma-glutamyltransferase n=1 Tax=Paraglaciecola aquimarina TaxID=1235557 RepID=A0ABU3SYR9_9ALTE|nr:gamma-glutamyltransferase [Paraglaciecola aquimarina]MDU0355062.1 gamma-glutamyltransferase [Paraglaciecola aquimarina]
MSEQSIKPSIAFTAPHYAATEAGIDILECGGSAVEAMVAAAAVISVVYPHMNSIGGDGFWIIDNQGTANPVAIDGCGRSAADISAYQTMQQIPARGGLSALTQAGTVKGWQVALEQDSSAILPLSKIFERAIYHAEAGFEVTNSLQDASQKLAGVTQRNAQFKDLYETNGPILKAKTQFYNRKLAGVFRHLASHGLSAFYQGELAQSFANDLLQAGSPLSAVDLANTQADIVNPLSIQLSNAKLFNLPAPTQGVHSLQILAIVDKIKSSVCSQAEWLHLIVEATKQSFAQRKDIWADPAVLDNQYIQALSPTTINQLATQINLHKAKPWPFDAAPGDTVWMGAKDKNGQMVSFIQSIYWEFGSGVAMADGGFVWNNRGVSFSLDNTQLNYLQANKKPAHTLNPAFAKFNDGRRMVYGTMGGEGQPQTQAAIFSNYAWRKLSLQNAISSERWLLGRTWGDTTSNLKVEQRLAGEVGDILSTKGHDWLSVPSNNEMMGHAGGIVFSEHQNTIEAASDPRSDGVAKIH